MDFSPLVISLKTSVFATAITFILGIYAARYVMNMKRFRGFIDGLFTLPMVLPPTVLGFFILILFGKNGSIGKILNYFDINIIFSWSATVIASVIVCFPLMYRTTLSAFEQIDKNIIYCAQSLGMSNRKIFWNVIFPNSKSGILAGLVLSFARALGEFGATIMVAGNIKGKTQTIAVAIYTAVQSGDRQTAYFWTIIVAMMSFTSIILLNYLAKRDV